MRLTDIEEMLLGGYVPPPEIACAGWQRLAEHGMPGPPESLEEFEGGILVLPPEEW